MLSLASRVESMLSCCTSTDPGEEDIYRAVADDSGGSVDMMPLVPDSVEYKTITRIGRECHAAFPCISFRPRFPKIAIKHVFRHSTARHAVVRSRWPDSYGHLSLRVPK